MGGWILLGVMVAILIGVIIGLYTRRGSQVSEHPTSEARGERAPGATHPTAFERQGEGPHR